MISFVKFKFSISEFYEEFICAKQNVFILAEVLLIRLFSNFGEDTFLKIFL
jgi:hypothetical protein